MSALLAVVVLLGAGCIVPPPAPLSSEADATTLAQDERYVWKQSIQSQHRLDLSGMVLEDPALEAYLLEVTRKLAGDELLAAGLTPRVRVISGVDMNAFAFPNGAVYVHTALLARMENEAQLAAMLSREYAHVIHRHAVLAHRDKKAKQAMMAASGIAASTVQGGGNLNALFKAGTTSSMFGYSYLLETQADAKGLELMDRADYDLEQAPRLFEITMAYLEEVHAQTPAPLPFAFSSPLHVKARVDAYRNLIARSYPESASESRILNEARFRREVQNAVRRQAALELDAGRFASAEKTIRRALETDPDDASAWVILGEALERGGEPASAAEAAEAVDAYERALALDARNARAHRALGLAFYRDARAGGAASDEKRRAVHHFERYLAISPRAVDGSYIRAYLIELRGGGTAGGSR